MLTKEQVRQVAALARVRASDDELTGYVAELGRILDHVARLQEVDTEGMPPTSRALEQRGVLREDMPQVPLLRETVLANAPEERHGMFLVPRVVEE